MPYKDDKAPKSLKTLEKSIIVIQVTSRTKINTINNW